MSFNGTLSPTAWRQGKYETGLDGPGNKYLQGKG